MKLRGHHREARRAVAISPLPAIAILCSGQGTNFQAILDAIHRPRRHRPRCRGSAAARVRRGRRKLRAHVAAMITDNPEAFAIVRAHKAKVPSIFISPASHPSSEAFDRALARVIEKSGARLVVLAGFMRILSPWFVRRFRGRVLNIHPSLLPAFPGAHAVRDALKARVKVTGVTVHFVDAQVDHGPVLVQETVPVREGDTEEILLRRIHRVEHRLYPRAIQMVLKGVRHRSA